MVDVKTEGGVDLGISMSGVLESGSCGIRLVGGVNPEQAFLRNRRTCRPDAKGEDRPGNPRECLTSAPVVQAEAFS